MTLKNKIELSLIIFLALSIFILIFLVYPLYKDIKDNAAELSFKKQDSFYIDNKLKNIEDFKKNYQEIGVSLEKGESLFVKSEAPVNLIGFLEKTSEDFNVPIKISPSAPVKKINGPWYSIVFQISASGKFPDILKFIEKLESGPYLSQIEILNITRLTADNLKSKEFAEYSVGDVKINFSIKAFANQDSQL